MWWASSSSAIFCNCTNQLEMICAESLASSKWSMTLAWLEQPAAADTALLSLLMQLLWVGKAKTARCAGPEDRRVKPVFIFRYNMQVFFLVWALQLQRSQFGLIAVQKRFKALWAPCSPAFNFAHTGWWGWVMREATIVCSAQWSAKSMSEWSVALQCYHQVSVCLSVCGVSWPLSSLQSASISAWKACLFYAKHWTSYLSVCQLMK